MKIEPRQNVAIQQLPNHLTSKNSNQNQSQPKYSNAKQLTFGGILNSSSFWIATIVGTVLGSLLGVSIIKAAEKVCKMLSNMGRKKIEKFLNVAKKQNKPVDLMQYKKLRRGLL